MGSTPLATPDVLARSLVRMKTPTGSSHKQHRLISSYNHRSTASSSSSSSQYQHQHQHHHHHNATHQPAATSQSQATICTAQLQHTTSTHSNSTTTPAYNGLHHQYQKHTATHDSNNATATTGKHTVQIISMECGTNIITTTNYGEESERTVELNRLTGGAEGGELDIKDDEPKDDRAKSNGPELKPDDDNTLNLSVSGSNSNQTFTITLQETKSLLHHILKNTIKIWPNTEQSTDEDTGSGDSTETGNDADESEDQVTEPDMATNLKIKSTGPADDTKAGDDDEFKLKIWPKTPEQSTDEDTGPEDSTRTDENGEVGESGTKDGDKSEDQVTGSGDSTKTGNDDEVELGSGAEGGELDTKDDEPKDEDESNGPEVKPEDNNNFESGSFGSDVVTADDESTDEGTGPEKNTESEDDNEVEESGTKDGEYDTENNQLQREGDKPEGEPENDNNPKSGPSGSDAVTASGESEDQVTEPETNTKTGDDDKVKPEGETNKPGAKKFSFGKMLNSFQQVFKKKPHSTHSQEHDQDMAKTPEQSTDEDTGPEDSTKSGETVEVEESGTKDGDFDTKDDQPEGGNGGPEATNLKIKSLDLEIALKTGNDGEVELGGGAEGGELDTKDDEPKDEDESNGPEVKPEDDDNFGSELSGSDAETTGDESEDQVTEPEYGTETGESGEIKLESGAEGGDFDTGNNNPEGGNGGPEVQPENDNNPKSGTSGSDAETAGEKSGDKSTKPADGTEAGGSGEVKPKVETTQSKTKRPSLSRSMAKSIREGLNKPFPPSYTQKHKQDMAKTSKKSKVKITGPKYDSGTEESDDSDSDSEGEYVFGGYDESENENNKLENDNNPKSGTSGSDAETAGEKSGDKVTGSGDDTGAGDDDEVKLEGGAKGGESKTEDAKLEDGAAKPENDRGSAFKLPWDSVMQDRKSRVHMPQVRRYNRYTQEKSE
ncbi:hypothetical protein BASA60_000984 [Batrachochytrium salamandrivorans]|nr:hypothetical protein BASA60_000984 [Batrachochytrium salamandrivorans]